MAIRTTMKRGVSGLVTTAMLLSMAMALPASAIKAGPDGYAAAGEKTYVSLHQYVSPTDYEDVYKVTLSVAGQFDQTARTEVVVVMDQSGSMNNDANGNPYDSLPGNNDMYDVLPSTPPGDEQYEYGVGAFLDEPAWLYPFQTSKYTDKAGFITDTTTKYTYEDRYVTWTGNVPSDGGSGLAGSGFEYTPSPPTFDYVIFPDRVHDYLLLHTPAVAAPDGWMLGAPPQPYYLTATIAQNHTATAASTDTRLLAAAKGVSSAIATFADSKKNPGNNRTFLGVTTFSSGSDASNSPWIDDVIYSYGTPTAHHFANFGYGNVYSSTTVPGAIVGIHSGINYSTRFDTDRSSMSSHTRIRNYHASSLGGSTTSMSDYLDGLVARDAQFLYQDKIYPNPHAQSHDMTSTTTQGGLLPMAQMAALESDLETRIVASTTEQNGTWIYDGIAEAANIFFGDVSNVAKKKARNNDPTEVDEVNRYVIILTDGENTDMTNNITQIMGLVSEMKNAGVQFMVMAIDSSPTTPTYDLTDLEAVINQIDTAGLAANDPDTSGNDMTPWMALMAMPMAGLESTGTAGTATDYMTVGDLDLTTVTNAPASSTNGQLSTSYSSWTDIVNDYRGTIANGDELVQDPWTQPAVAYIPSTNPDRITTVFNQFVDQIIKLGEGTKVDAALNGLFNVYQMPGEPLFTVDGRAAVAGEVSNTKSSFTWNLLNEIPLGGRTTLSFYVKVDMKSAQPGMFYSILDSAVLTSYGRFYHEGDNPGPVLRKIDLAKSFSPAYVNPIAGTIDQESAEGDVTSDALDGINLGTTGAQGHQQNRKDGESTRNYTSALTNAAPKITGLSVGTGLSGKPKAIVNVENSSYMRFQWQYKDEDGEWKNIFGATSSQYTLGGTFVAGTEYELRCRITNDAGSVFYTDVLKITAASATKSEGLQSK